MTRSSYLQMASCHHESLDQLLIRAQVQLYHRRSERILTLCPLTLPQVFIPITCSLTPCLLLHSLSCNTVVALLRYSFQHWDGLLFNPSSLTAHQRWPTVTLCAIIASRLTQWLNLPLAKAVVISSPAVPFFWILLKHVGVTWPSFFVGVEKK